MKKVNSVFDVLGPIMIGPSSSHTAGAARLGKIAWSIAQEDVMSVKFYLHGSFAKTYKGHGSDKALLAGILGMSPFDENLKNSFEIAKQKKISYEFIPKDLGPVHANTVKIDILDSHQKLTTITGSSIGGGPVLINEINGYEEVDITCDYSTLVIRHFDRKGIIGNITSCLNTHNINIARMKVTRQSKGEIAQMIIEADDFIGEAALDAIEKIENVILVIKINPIKSGD